MDLYAVTSLLVLWVTCSRAATNQTVVYTWVTVEYDWPNDTMKADYIETKKYIVENNIVTGIKLYKDDVFLTVSRWRPGVPSTLNRVVTKGGKSVLQPYPGWEDQTVGQCDALQYVQSMEVDPNTGFIWIIDNGRTNTMETTPSNLCPPKLVVYDINKKKEVRRYTFPDDVANHTSCFLNDIVLDYVNGDVKFAYITDTNDAKLYVYDYDKDESYFFQDDTMKATSPGGKFPIDGIAMSPDFKYVYYCPLDGLGTFQVYKDDVFITVPRWRPGVPSTLNRVVMKGGKSVLAPYPGWEDQTVGQCGALQYVQSMEVDPNTGFIWIIDNGRTDILEAASSNLCPPKLVIYDINRKKEVRRYTFPDDVANHTSCFLNDIVLDYVNGDVKFAYITDTRDAKLYVYDYAKNTSYFFQDVTMKPTKPNGMIPIDGIAMSADFRYVYYCPIDGLGLFQIPTSVLRDRDAQFSQHVRNVATRLSRSDGLAYGQRSLFYGLVDTSGVQRWLVSEDAKKDGYDIVTLTSQEALAREDVRMRWVDTFAWDESGHLWFTANDLARYMNRSMDFTGASGPNMYVWKVLVNETSYLCNADEKTAFKAPGIIGK